MNRFFFFRNLGLVYWLATLVFIAAVVARVAFKVDWISDNVLFTVLAVTFALEALKSNRLHTIQVAIDQMVLNSDTSYSSSVFNEVTTDQTSYDNVTSNGATIVLAKASWCGACKAYISSKRWEALQASAPNMIDFQMLDIDQNRKELGDYGISSSDITFVPTMFFCLPSVGNVFHYEGDVTDNDATIASFTQWYTGCVQKTSGN